MVVGRFNEKLMEYPDEKLMTAYEELQILSETGAFPPNTESFQQLAKVRQQIYNTDYSLDATRTDILEEIARRWYYSKKEQVVKR